MKKRIIAMIMAGVLAMLCTGCKMVIDVNTSYDKHGRGTVCMVVGVDKELYDTLTSEEFQSESSGSEDSDISDFVEIQLGEETIYGEKEEFKFNSFDELNKMMIAPSEDGSNALFDSFTASKKGITAKPNANYLNSEEFSGINEAQIPIDMKFSVTTEAEIISCNGVLSADKHTATWNMSDFPEEIVMETKVGFPLWIILLIAVIILGAIVGFLFYRAKQQQDELRAENQSYDSVIGVATSDAVAAAADAGPDAETEKNPESCDEDAESEDASKSDSDNRPYIPEDILRRINGCLTVPREDAPPADDGDEKEAADDNTQEDADMDFPEVPFDFPQDTVSVPDDASGADDEADPHDEQPEEDR